MAQPDDLQAKMAKAVELIGEAEFYEQAGDLENAVPRYEEAAHLLSQAAFPGEKVGELYDRIKLLKQAMQQQILQKAVAKGQESANAEDEAFSLIDQAESALKSGEFESALDLYQQAMPKLEKAGYSTQHVQEKIQQLSSRVRQPPSVVKPAYSPATTLPAKIIKPVGVIKPMKPAGMHKPEIAPPVESSEPEYAPAAAMAEPVPAKAAPAMASKATPDAVEPHAVMEPLAAKITEVPVEEVKKFEEFKEFRGKVEEMESKAFELVDKAKSLTEEEKYMDALSTYGIIMNLLKNAGWKDDQLEPILIQENLVKEIMETQNATKRMPVPSMEPATAAAEADIPRIVKQKLDLFLDQDTKMRQFKESQVNRQNVEADAFTLINDAQKLYKFVEIKDYPGAIELYQRAIQMLARAGWIDQISYLQLEVEKLKDLYEQQARMEQARHKEERLAEEDAKMQTVLAHEKKQAVESNLASISTMLGRIDSQKKKEIELAELEGIKQKLLEEKRYKDLVSRPKGEKSFDSIKEMLFGDKDTKAAAQKEAEKKQREQDFLSNVSKKFYSFKKAEKDAEAPAMQSVEKVVDFVHQETIATQRKERVQVDIVDPKKKQEQEVKKAQQDKDQAVGDVLSMLGAMKQKKAEKKPEDEKEMGIKDDELKKMFSDLKKKQL
jgi:tetratricopeptide (TPR) repeat protein